jgi:carboxymethylenebutenolidase
MERTMNPNTRVASDIAGLIKIALLSRRGFMSASAAAAAGYTLAAGPVRAEAIRTDTSGIDAGDAKIKVSDGEMPVYFARPSGVENPPIIVVAMEIFGLHEYIKDVTRRLAKLGAFAVAPDYYFRLGDLTRITEINKLMPLVNSKSDAELISDLDAAVQWATSQGGDRTRLGIMGFCRGGRTVWEYCTANAGVKAGVAFYGSLADPASQKSVWPKSPLQLAPEMKAPVLGLYGGDDQGISAAQIEEMKASLKSAGKTAEFKIYPGAPHGFHADYRPSYRKEAAKDAWQQMAAWFKKWGVLR